MKSLILALALLAPAMAHAADPGVAQPRNDHPIPAEGSDPLFELFRLVPGRAEEFIKGVAIWDQVNAAGGQPKTHLYLHEDGEGWDVMLYKPPRKPPTPAQQAAMEAKMKELGLVGGPMFFLQLRENVADHAHIVMKGPQLAEDWLVQLEKQRAEFKARKK